MSWSFISTKQITKNNRRFQINPPKICAWLCVYLDCKTVPTFTWKLRGNKLVEVGSSEVWPRENVCPLLSYITYSVIIVTHKWTDLLLEENGLYGAEACLIHHISSHSLLVKTCIKLGSFMSSAYLIIFSIFIQEHMRTEPSLNH